MEVSGKVQNSLELSYSCQIEALSRFWKHPGELRKLWNLPEEINITYDIIVLSCLFQSFLKSIYKNKFS